MTTSDEFFGFKVESLAGGGDGSRNGSADEGLFREFFFLLLLGILTENRICMGMQNRLEFSLPEALSLLMFSGK